MRIFKLKIPIFKSGQWTSLQGAKRLYTESELKEVAELYNQGRYQAKLFITHEQAELPVKPSGIISSLMYDNRNGMLHANLADVSAEAYDLLVNNAEVSASFFLPNHPNSPTPGKLFLNHVAIVPQGAVKGLEVGFADIVCDFHNEEEQEEQEDKLMSEDTQEYMPEPEPDYQAEIKRLVAENEEMERRTAQYAERMIKQESQQMATKMVEQGQANPEQAQNFSDIYSDIMRIEYGLASFEASFEEAKEHISERLLRAIESLPRVVITNELTADHSEKTTEAADPFIAVFETKEG